MKKCLFEDFDFDFFPPYLTLCMGGYIVQDDPYVSILFQELWQINCLASSDLTKLFLVSDKYPTRKTENKALEYTYSFCKIDVDLCKPGYFKNISSKAKSIN